MSEVTKTMTEQEQKALMEKFRADTDFHQAAKECKNIKELYDLYLKSGYTNMDYEAFVKALGDRVGQIYESGERELSDEELEQVVGGGWFDVFKKVVNCIPIVGPLVGGVASAIKTGIEGGSISKAIVQVAAGLGASMAASVVAIGTAGLGTGAAVGIQMAMNGVVGGVLDEATKHVD